VIPRFAVMTAALVLAAASPTAVRGPGDGPGLARHFGGLDGTFVLLDATAGTYERHAPERARRRFAPCSTFKIANTAILLESGAAPDPAFTLPYDPRLAQPAQWARDFSLAGAFKASALWYYQAMARRAGMDAMRTWVERFDYGNEDVSGGIDRAGTPFWVDGSLRISADEQVGFLRRLREGRLGLSDRVTRMTLQVMVAEQGSAWRLSAKTGACRPSGEDTSNWYVGFVERRAEVHYFALQIGAPEYGRAFEQRVPIARAILRERGLID
jgi:beta-lactamase class D